MRTQSMATADVGDPSVPVPQPLDGTLPHASYPASATPSAPTAETPILSSRQTAPHSDLKHCPSARQTHWGLQPSAPQLSSTCSPVRCHSSAHWLSVPSLPLRPLSRSSVFYVCPSQLHIRESRRNPEQVFVFTQHQTAN